MGEPDVPAGFLLVDKPLGVTSHDVVAAVRRQLGTRKVGHAGTLDPRASGVMVLGVGRATRLLTFLVGLDKAYLATFRLGRATSTDDGAGQVLGDPSSGVAALTESAIREALRQFTGPLHQVPPVVSAIKQDGVRSYTRARRGQDVSLDPRPVTVHSLTCLAVSHDRWADGDVVDVEVEVEVSSGTYVRSLARDLGAALGVAGHVSALRRTGVGPFDVGKCLPILMRGADQVSGEFRREVCPDDVIPAQEWAARLWPTVVVPPDAVAAVRHGRRIRAQVDDGDAPWALLSAQGSLLAIAHVHDGNWRYRVVFGAPDPSCPEPTGEQDQGPCLPN